MLEWNRIASLVLLYSLFFTPITSAADTFDPSQFIRDGETIVSSGGMFEMGFFSPGGSKNRYVGIWYKKISTGTVVWVANREVPITDTSGVLKIISPGRIVLVDGNNTNVWSSNTRRPALKPTIAQLLDSGNLVVRDLKDDSPVKFLWQSFDYPGDTLLPGMKLGIEFSTGLERYLSSWRSMDDPSAGNFTYYCDPKGYPQTMLKRGNITEVRSGFWNDRQFIGMHRFNQDAVYTYRLVLNKEEVYYSFIDWSPVVSRFVLAVNSLPQHLVWNDKSQSWFIYMTVLADQCDTYSLCGAYGSCNINYAPPCTCLHKFVPRNHEEWNSRDWSNGCVRRTPLSCSNDGFLKYSGIKLPDSSFSWFDERMSLDECSRACLRNCSCVAYANKDITTGCIHWFGELIDIRDFNEGGQDIYIRMADTELDPGSGRKTREVITITVILSTLAGLVLLGTILTVYAWRRTNRSLRKRVEGTELNALVRDYTLESPNEDVELQSFSLSTIENATENFSDNNKLGQGGFGPVYKGLLEEGREVAVKRLSKTSKQGLDEFKNEVICIAKLQHRNLVKLLGCCTQGDEMMLIYEYMPNRSLDCFIFDESQSSKLDWPKRLHIINGIARGLTYLHQDSRLRIVHRDLKAGNILLDIDMNPKISDFGLARRFCGLETGANTNTVVGTYGYISPEYAVNGLFSVKSDVFSFGVLVLEIISGKKNRGFSHRDHHDNLLGHAWRLYKEGKSLELIDEPLGHSYTESEVLRSIHVGLLCVQQRAEDRPSMSSVVMMLGSEGAILPPPNQPGFFVERSIPGLDCAQSKPLPVSINEFTMTLLDAR